MTEAQPFTTSGIDLGEGYLRANGGDSDRLLSSRGGCYRAMVVHPSKLRLLLFASGDFAFNLYWQSIMLFLLFYYTDALVLPIGVAATTYMIASIWDGMANFVTGMLVDRWHKRIRFGAL